MTIEDLRAHEHARVERIRLAAGIVAEPFTFRFDFERGSANCGGKCKCVYADDGRSWDSAQAAAKALRVSNQIVSWCCRNALPLKKRKTVRLSYSPFPGVSYEKERAA
jgi:hypothetical protein